MAKLIADVMANYVDILSNTIPHMVSKASPAARLGVYCAAALLYPLVLVVLFVLVSIAAAAVFVVHPIIAGGGTLPSP